MIVSILGAGAMGSALSVPLTDNRNEVRIWGTEYDVEILDLMRKGMEHPRLGVKLNNVSLFYSDQLHEALEGSDVIVLGVSTDGVLPVFERISEFIEDQYLVLISKGLLEIDGEIMTVPEAIWRMKKSLRDKTVAITGPAIAREVAKRMPTRVVFSSTNIESAIEMKRVFETHHFGVEVTDDIEGTEVTSALKNVYSIAIAWVRGYESTMNVEMSNAKGVIATKAINEIAEFIELLGGNRMTAFGLSGFGDLIATFRGGRNGMLGELLGKGYTIQQALDELSRKGVGVVEGYKTAKKAYKLLKRLEEDGKAEEGRFRLLENIYQVLYEGKKVASVFEELIVEK
ncbi:NAD(P)H-dependent glycerol-3-phosphate dehydrogenase [Archaeoglobus neptunius]|uniref:NAD(P)H-dependent glycerol-3-phosphate dehydrogenase n=1 Tax=Archaeoglobus neptunius TaxID=2798580 RepID=UPI0019282BE6|nr:NAD(P)H-dependent glycerol-3-phosphate dehydrogenase [Archaeoglobus neptunius]